MTAVLIGPEVMMKELDYIGFFIYEQKLKDLKKQKEVKK